MSGDTVPDSLVAITLRITIAGRNFTHTLSRDHPSLHQCPSLGSGTVTTCPPPFTPGNDTLTNRKYLFTWDGKDTYGRTLQGSHPVTVRIGYVYRGVYMEPYQAGNAFAALSGVPISESLASVLFTLWQDWNGRIDFWDARGQELGGWTLNVHHAYDPAGRVLYLGSGEKQGAKWIRQTVATAAGDLSSFTCYPPSAPCGDGGPATEAILDSLIYGVAVAPDGSLYLTDQNINRIRKVGPDGIISTAAGTGSSGFYGDGRPAKEAYLNFPYGIAVGEDDALYIADLGNQRIRRVGPDGIITTVAGNGTRCTTPTAPCGDNGPATSAQLNNPMGVALGPDGSLYIADYGTNRIRKVSPDGMHHDRSRNRCQGL